MSPAHEVTPSPPISATTANVFIANLLFIVLFSLKSLQTTAHLLLRKTRCNESQLSLEKNPGVQIERIVGARVAAEAVVVRRCAIEARIAGVLRGELQVLPRPVREVQNVSRASRVAIEIAGHGSPRRIKYEIRCPGCMGQADRARVLVADVIFGICHDRVQMVRTLRYQRSRTPRTTPLKQQAQQIVVKPEVRSPE